MFQCFYPSKMEESSYVIPYENWKKMGIQGIVYDIDNTLVPHGAPADERAIRLFEHLRGLGLKTCLLSNNKEPRVKSFAEQVKCPYIYKGGKPGAKGYKKAMETIGDRCEKYAVCRRSAFYRYLGRQPSGDPDCPGTAHQPKRRDPDRIKTLSGKTGFILLQEKP